MPVERNFPGVRIVWEERETWVFGSPARLRREAQGAERVPMLAPALLRETEEARIYEASVPTEYVNLGWTSVDVRRLSVREQLMRLSGEFPEGETNPLKGLAALIGRGPLDRLLFREVEATFLMGPVSLGPAGAWAEAASRPVSLVLEKARAEGTLLLDWRGQKIDLRHHHEGVGDADASERAAALVELYFLATDLRAPAREERAREQLERLFPSAPRVAHGQRFSVRLQAPGFLSLAPWIPGGSGQTAENVPFSAALSLLSSLDGLFVAGERVSVETVPSLQKPNRAPPREEESQRRKRIFSKWNQGIVTDEEGLFSATPEALAQALARTLRGPVIDGTAGLGCLSIACATMPAIPEVWAIDLDPARLELARQNARIYGVQEKMKFRSGDLLKLLPRLPAEATLLLDPPWGGRDYNRQRMGLGDLPMDLRPILRAHRGPVVLKLPRSFLVSEIPEFRIEAAVDGRGVLKFLWARRDRLG